MKAPWFQNVGLKALSLVVALLLWMSVAGEQTVERTMRVPLELREFPAGLELVGDFPTAADVRVRGSVAALSRVGAGDIVAVIALAGVEPGPKLFRLTPDDVRAPVGIDVVQVNPTTVAMTFVNPAMARTLPAGRGGQAVERTLGNRPLELRGLPSNLTASAIPGQVDVTVDGSRETLVLVQPDDIHVYVDLSGLGAGEYALTVRANLARDASIVRVAPSTVQVRIADVK